MKGCLCDARRSDSKADPTDPGLLQDPLEIIREDRVHMCAVRGEMERVSQNLSLQPVELSRLLRFPKHGIVLPTIPARLAEDDKVQLRNAMIQRRIIDMQV